METAQQNAVATWVNSAVKQNGAHATPGKTIPK
jgi:hypothetical protein